MKPVGVRLLLVSLLFAGWLGYLGYLVTTRPVRPDGRPMVLSRPQFLASQFDLVVEIAGPNEPATVVKILYPEDPASPKVGDKIDIAGIEEARPVRRNESDNPPPDYSGPGEYLVPLNREGKGYVVTPIPPSPGFFPETTVLRLYPASAEALAQYRELGK